MSRVSNPYNIHALYNSYNPWEEGKACPMECGTRALPPTQIKLGVSASGSSYSATIINPDSGYSLDVSSDISRTIAAGATFYEYDGSNLASDLDEGTYQLKMVIGGTEYWGYPYCAKTAYRASSYVPIPSVACTSSGAGNYTHTYTLVNAAEATAYLMEYNIGSGWVEFGGPSGAITQADWGDSGTITGTVRITTYRNHHAGEAYYSVSFSAASPCTPVPSLEGVGGTGTDNFMVLEWTNANDLQNMGLYYAGGYTQRYYFEAAKGFPEPVLEDNFVENGAAGLYLESAVVAERVNVDCYPVPDHAATVLASVRLHSTINMDPAFYQGDEYGLTNFAFAPTPADGTLCQSGRFSWDRNRAYVGGCQEDYTIS